MARSSVAKVEIPGGDKPVEGPIGRIWEGDFVSAFSDVFPWKEQNPIDAEKTAALIDEIRTELLPIVNTTSIEEEREVPIAVLEKMSDLGLFALKVPEERFGKGLSQWSYNDVLGFLGSVSSALAAYASAHNSLGALYPILYYGTEEQRQKFLLAVMRWPTGFCFTEQMVGSDPASMQTYATRVRNEDKNLIGYRLNGEKWYTTNALRAKYLAVVANTIDWKHQLLPGFGKCFSLFLVRTDSPGVIIGPPNKFAGMHGIDNANPQFRDVFVLLDHRIGPEGKGFNIALEALNTGRIAVAAIASAAVKQALSISREWANKRDQRGLIGKYELIQEKLFRMAVELYAMETLVQCAASRSDRHLDASVEAAAAKIFATEVGWQCVDDMLQIRGGRGYEASESLRRREEWAPPVERIWRDLRVARVFEGTSEILTLWDVARGLYPYLGLAARAVSGGVTTKAKVGLTLLLWHEKLRFSKRHNWKDVPPELRNHLDFAERASRQFARQIIGSCLKYQKKLQHKQLLIERMFWISARILTIALVVARASASGRKEEVALADAYARHAAGEIKRLFFEWGNNEDGLVRPSAEKILGGEFSFLERGII